MSVKIVSSSAPVLLVGGGNVDKTSMELGLALTKTIVAADGGAGTVLTHGHMPEAVIGDMDSISQETRARIPDDRQHHIAEQDSTDFEKCLRAIEAPLVIGLGFLGRRVDHTMAALSVMVRRTEPPCILLGRHDAICAAPPELSLTLPVGSRVSLFPMAPVTGRSTGLRWPIEGLGFAPAGTIGTSNESVSPEITLSFDGPGMALILPASALEALVTALQPPAAR